MKEEGVSNEKLLKDYQELQLRVTQFSNVEQELINTRDRLDQELLLYKRLNNFNKEALKDISYAKLLQLGTEAIVDIFEMESSLVCVQQLDRGKQGWDIFSEGFKFPEERSALFLDDFLDLSNSFAPNRVHVIKSDQFLIRNFFSSFSRGLFYHFKEEELGIQGAFFALISKEYDPIYKQIQQRHETMFSVFSQQFQSLIFNSRKSIKIKSQFEQITNSEKELKKLSLIATKTVNGVIISDPQGRIEWVNEGFTKITGYTLEEVLGKKPKDFLQGEKSQVETLKKLSDALWKKEAVDLTLINYNKRGEPYFNALQITPVFDEDGNHIHFIALQRDISSEINAKQEILNVNSRFELITNKAMMGIWEWDLVKDKTIWNDIQYQQYGAKKNELDTNFFEFWAGFLHPQNKERVLKNFEEFFHSGKEILEDEFEIIRENDGEQRTIKALLIAERSSANTITRIVGTSIDITEIKNNELALQFTLRQQEVLSEISLQLNAVADFETQMNSVMEKLGVHTGVSRVYVFENNKNNETCTNTFEWCNQGVEPQIENLQDIPYEIIPYWKKTLQEKGLIYSENIAELPEEVRAILEPQQIKSIVVYPLNIKGKFFGFIGFDECTRYKKWSKIELELLRGISGILSNAYEKHLTEKTLKTSESKYRGIIENMSLGLVETDVKGEVVFFNKKFKEILNINHPFSIALGHLPIQTLRELEKNKLISSFSQLEESVFEISFRDVLGNKKYVLVSHAATLDQQENISGHINIVLDITRVKVLQKNLEEALSERDVLFRKVNSLKLFYESVLNHAPSEIAVLSPELHLTFSNEHFYRFNQPWKLQLKGDFNQANLNEESLVIEEIKRSVAEQKMIRLEEKYISSQNEEFYFLRTILPYFNDANNLENVILTGVDISEIKRFENNLILKNEELSKINSELDSFVYSVSHDLRSPLLSVKGILSLVFKSGTLDDKNQSYLRMAETSILKLDATIQEILEYSRNSRLEVIKEKVNVKNLVQSIFDDLKFSVSTKILSEIEIEGEEVVFTDKARVKTLLSNILGNAFKYHREDVVNPYVNFKMFRNSNNIVLEIKDNGEGISEKNIPQLFQMFYRASSKAVGSGLGLYICKEIVNKLGGRIEVKSKLKEGSTFTIFLPID